MTSSREEVLLGVDLGTSSMKGVAVTATGEVVGDARAEYRMIHPHPGWNENDPADWEMALNNVIGRLSAATNEAGHRVRSIGLVAQRDPFVPLDDDDRPTGPAISWTDARTTDQLVALQKSVERQRLIELTGGLPVVGGGLLNLMWMREHDPQGWSRTTRAVAPKDYLLGVLGAGRGTDPTTPTRSIAFDVRQADWSAEILGATDIARALFDPVISTAVDAVGVLDPDWAGRFGLPDDVVLAGGCADDHAAAVGSGVVEAGQRSLGTGTCSSWRLAVDSYQPDLEGRVDCSPYVLPNTFMREATIDSVGSSLRWFRDVVFPELTGSQAYDAILGMASEAPRGAEGVQFYPFVDGAQRAPFFQSCATATLLGVTGKHTRAHLARAVIESIALLYLPTLELMGGRTGEPLTIVDGEAASAFWNQMKADVMGCPVRTPAVLDAAAMGAAVLASVAAGVHLDITTAVAQMIRFAPVIEPDAAAHEAYRDQWEQYATTFEALRPIYEARRER